MQWMGWCLRNALWTVCLLLIDLIGRNLSFECNYEMVTFQISDALAGKTETERRPLVCLRCANCLTCYAAPLITQASAERPSLFTMGRQEGARRRHLRWVDSAGRRNWSAASHRPISVSSGPEEFSQKKRDINFA